MARHPAARVERVGAQPEPQRLEPSASAGAMLPRLTSAPKRRISQACWSLRGASNTTASTPTASTTASTTSHAHLAVRVEQPDGAALAALGDHPGRAGVEVGRGRRAPTPRADTSPRVLRPISAEHDEALGGPPRSGRALLRRVIGATPQDTSTHGKPGSAGPVQVLVGDALVPGRPRAACRRCRPSTPCSASSASFSGSPGSR